MAHRAVRDVMTANVPAVTEDTGFKDLAEAVTRCGLGAVPVVDAQGKVTGVVSEPDLLRKEEYQEDQDAGPAPHGHRAARRRASALTAREVMSSPAITIAPDASVVAAARAMDRHRVRHLMVPDASGGLAGMVSAGDLLKVYLRSDEEIRGEILDEVIIGYLGTDPGRVELGVTDGAVMLGGEVETKSMIRLAVRLIRSVDGVVGVTETLSYARDDSHLPPSVSEPTWRG